VAAILNSVDGRHHEMSGDIDSHIQVRLVASVRVEVEIVPLSQAVQKLLPLQFFRPPSGFPVEGDVGFFRGCTIEKFVPENGG